MKEISENKTMEVPAHLKDTHYKGAEQLGHGQGYQYAHDFEGHVVAQEHLPQKVKFYEPTTQGHEKKFKEYLESLRKIASAEKIND